MINGLDKNSTRTDVFEFIDNPDVLLHVLPLTVSQDENDTRLCIFVRGPHEDASMVFAGLMSHVQDLHDQQTQAAAEDEEKKFVL
jgi:hypothetical protein